MRHWNIVTRWNTTKTFFFRNINEKLKHTFVNIITFMEEVVGDVPGRYDMILLLLLCIVRGWQRALHIIKNLILCTYFFIILRDNAQQCSTVSHRSSIQCSERNTFNYFITANKFPMNKILRCGREEVEKRRRDIR